MPLAYVILAGCELLPVSNGSERAQLRLRRFHRLGEPERLLWFRAGRLGAESNVVRVHRRTVRVEGEVRGRVP